MIFDAIQDIHCSKMGKSLPEFSISEILNNHHNTKDMIKNDTIYKPDPKFLSKHVYTVEQINMQTPYAPPDDEIIEEVSMSKEDSKVEKKYMEVAQDLDDSNEINDEGEINEEEFEVLDDEVPEDEPPQLSMSF